MEQFQHLMILVEQVVFSRRSTLVHIDVHVHGHVLAVVLLYEETDILFLSARLPTLKIVHFPAKLLKTLRNNFLDVC